MLLRAPIEAARAFSTRFGRGGVALLIGLPLAFGAIGIPSTAMVTGASVAPRLDAAGERTLQIFTSRNTRQQFLTPPPKREFTLELAKEEFFRTSIPYGSIIYAEARRRSLPPELVAAVVAAESDFRVHLVSHRDARGLMQIIPATGRYLGAGDLFDPHQNIAAGTKYLRYLIDRFRDPRLALAAYNAGASNVEKWGGVPPFPETEAYLARVNARASIYRTRIRDSYNRGLRAAALQ